MKPPPLPEVDDVPGDEWEFDKVDSDGPVPAPPPVADPLSEHEAAQLAALVDSGLSPDFACVVVSVHRVDIAAEYARLEKDLAPDETRSDYGTIYKYVDRCEDNARIAHKLFIAATVEYERAKRAGEKLMVPIRDHAMRELKAEKDNNLRTKAITNDDVTAKMVELHGDEIDAQEDLRMHLRNTRDHLEELSRIWKSRCNSATSLLQSQRK